VSCSAAAVRMMLWRCGGARNELIFSPKPHAGQIKIYISSAVIKCPWVTPRNQQIMHMVKWKWFDFPAELFNFVKIHDNLH